ncbi:type IV secretion system protein [Solibacillus sp. NPDC093137]|uniref:type IV secretion system protein n=1 Tax=Solibacillus sp. NPDC093137 TaxID=3390678 RepID=UPI003CFD3EFC
MFDTISSKIADIIGGLIQKIFDSIMWPFADVYTIDELIFGDIGGNGANVYWGVFTETELSYGFLPLYYTILTLAAVFFVGFIVVAGMRIASSSKSASKRNEMIEFTKELIIVGLAFIFLPTFYTVLFQVNESIVGIFDDKLKDGIFDINNAIWSSGDDEDGDLALAEDETFSTVKGFIGKILINFVIFGLGIWANFYYLMRRVTLLILMSIGPLMVVFWMFPQWKSITMTWLKELTGTIFVQSIHAFVFWLVAVVSITESNSGSGLIGALIVYIIFIPISEQIRGLLGMGGNMVGGLNKAGAMMGMAALGGMAGAVKGAIGGEGVMSALKGLKDGTKKIGKDIKDGKGVGEALKDAGGRAAESAFASAKNMNMLKAGEIASKAGKAVGGIAGSLAGSPMGPIAAIAGAEIGSKGTGAVSGLAGRVGYAGGSKVASRFKGAKEGLDALNDARTNGDANVANAIADQEAASWGNQHKEATMKQLRESFPTASQQELDQKYSNIVAQKAQQFKANAGNTMAQAKMIAGNMSNAQNATQTAASAMADQWSADNKDAFMSDWKANNPRDAKESMGSYNKRAQKAFGDKKASMQESFAKDGELFARDNGINGEVDKERLATFMGAAASKYAGAGNTSNLTSAASNAMAHVSGAKMFDGAGKPNMPLIANSIAAAKTEQDKNAHIQSAMAGGATMEQAQASWKQVEASTMAKNLQPFATKGFENSLVGKSVDTSGGRLQATAQNFGNMVKGAYAQDMQALKNGTAVLSSALGAGKEAFTTGMATNGNMMNTFGNAVSSASQAASQQIVANYGGDAVKAQQAITQSAGFAGGVLLGRRGMEMAQGGALGVMTRTGLGNAVQAQVSSASEIIQMAHKVQDENGNMQVAPGAIKQVTTRDGSYVQVRTASGETRTVSRIGAGSESLKKGEVIYQDMTSSDGSTMEIAKVGNTGVSTYKMDSGGARIPVQHDVQNPMALIGGATSSPVHGHVSRPVAPPLQQRVDAGTYHTEDLASAVQSGQLSNVQVVIDKGQQYLTADSGGQTYRVSPVTKGDARMSNNQSISIPVEVNSAGQIAVPQSNVEIGPSGAPIGAKGVVSTLRQSVANVTETQTVSSPNGQNIVRQVNQAKVNVLEVEDANGQTTNAVPNVVTQTVKQVIASQQPQMKGNVNIPNSVGQASVQQGTEDYVLGQVDFSHLMKSRTYEHAQRNVNRRRQLDEVRSPQGQAF